MRSGNKLIGSKTVVKASSVIEFGTSDRRYEHTVTIGTAKGVLNKCDDWLIDVQRWYCMVLYGTVWYCMVLYGTVWYCMVLYGTVWYCMVLYGTVWYCMVLYGTVWYCMVLYGVLSRSPLL